MLANTDKRGGEVRLRHFGNPFFDKLDGGWFVHFSEHIDGKDRRLRVGSGRWKDCEVAAHHQKAYFSRSCDALAKEAEMQIAILTFDGFNELDSFIAAGILNRMRPAGWSAQITSPTLQVTSMNGVTIQRQQPLSFAATADAVLIGSGIKTRDIAADADLLAQLPLDPARQLIGAQCSGTLILAKLGLIGALPACTDLTTKPWVVEAGINVIDAPFVAHGNVATAGGCLASQYLAAWMIARGAGFGEARSALHYVAPVGEKEAYVERAVSVIAPYIGQSQAA